VRYCGYYGKHLPIFAAFVSNWLHNLVLGFSNLWIAVSCYSRGVCPSCRSQFERSAAASGNLMSKMLLSALLITFSASTYPAAAGMLRLTDTALRIFLFVLPRPAAMAITAKGTSWEMLQRN
jgi:hypothetical protein